MARFYGFSHSEISKMPYEEFITYYKGISVVSSEEHLMNTRIVSFPDMKKETQRKFESSLRRAMKENVQGKPNTKTPQEIAADFARKLGHGQ